MSENVQDETIGNEHLYRALRLTVENYNHENNTATGHGTGFIVRSHTAHISPRFGAHFLITNRHVVDRSYPITDPGRWPTSNIASIQIDGYFQAPRDPHAALERTSLTIGDPEPVYPTSEDIDVAVFRLSDVKGRSIAQTFNSFDIALLQGYHEIMDGEIQVGSSLLMPGYPSLAEKISDRPTLVGGWIASDPRYSASMLGKDRPRRVLGHSFSRAGMSGAPVLGLLPRKDDHWTGDPEGARVTLLGINTGHIRIEGDPSVISEFMPAPAILSTIARAGDSYAAERVRAALRYPTWKEQQVEDLWLPEPLPE